MPMLLGYNKNQLSDFEPQKRLMITSFLIIEDALILPGK